MAGRGRAGDGDGEGEGRQEMESEAVQHDAEEVLHEEARSAVLGGGEQWGSGGDALL